MACRVAGGVAGLDVDQHLVDDHRGDLEVGLPAAPAAAGAARAGRRSARGRRSRRAAGPGRCAGRESVGSASSTYRFCTAGRRITCRPTPTVAALGRVVSGGTSTARSRVAVDQAGEPPARRRAGRAVKVRDVVPGDRASRAAGRPAPCTCGRCRGRRRWSRSRCRSTTRRRRRVTPGRHAHRAGAVARHRSRSSTVKASSTRPGAVVGGRLGAGRLEQPLAAQRRRARSAGRSSGSRRSRRLRSAAAACLARCAAIQAMPHSSWSEQQVGGLDRLDDLRRCGCP